jgi:hypothetical protein
VLALAAHHLTGTDTCSGGTDLTLALMHNMLALLYTTTEGTAHPSFLDDEHLHTDQTR